ncbi:nitronate monooxygenase family protein [Neobacillus niacini]|uniref:NAD(P)H-dependent flavin oxidoreductase n=1 Tax=Neobacillus niacini TaxID=86668 RepID=UPI001C8DE75C|nr:nitronate monooxygenase [Neobacillus niacini]MBY0148209.1 nitronate monooxygenase [Neobacillus niacini]
MFTNKLTGLLKIEHPIIQAPMAGGITTSKLVAEVSNAGGLGMIGAGYMTPAQIRDQIKEIKQLTKKPFGINLFVPNDFSYTENEVNKANQLLQPIRNHLQIHHDHTIDLPTSDQIIKTFNEQIKVVIEERIPVCSFTFGIPSEEVIADLRRNDVILIGTATTVEEAIEVEKSGMDMVVVQGSEAGGHRGNFISESHNSLIGLMSLIPQIVDHVSIPVIAAGGIMDGRGLTASLCLGAMGVQMGTAFLTCIESGAQQKYKEAILHASEDQTVLTRTFSGKWARGIKNKFIVEMEKYEDVLPEFPVQNTLTQPIRKASSSQQNADYLSLWSGQSPRLAKTQSVRVLFNTILTEAKNIQNNL